MRRFAPYSLSLVLLFTAGACGDDEGPRVPLRTERAESPTAAPEVPNAPRAQGQSLPAGTQEVQVEGATFSSRGHELRALLALDADGDGDRDVIAVAVAPEPAEVVVLAGRRGTNRFDVRILGRASVPEGCEVGGATIAELAPTLAHLTSRLRCADQVGSTHWIASLEASPRIRESLIVHADAVQVDPRFAAAAIDDDDHLDLEAAMQLSRGSASAEVKLQWLDRAGGLARVEDEPRATLERAVQGAREAAAGDPESAMRAADHLEILHRAFCRHEASVLALGGARGLLACPSWNGTVAAVRAVAQIRQGALADALVRLDPSQLQGEDRRLAMNALGGTGPSIEAREAYRMRAMDADSAAHLTLHFDEDGALHVRDARPVRIAPGESPAPMALARAPVRDASGRFAVLRTRRSCEGVVVDIGKADALSTSFAPHSTPLLLSDPEEPCDAASLPATRWRVLGWAPQGLLAALGSRRRVLPLTADATAAGPPVELDAGAPAPAPLRGGRVTADGSVWIEETAFGVLRHEGDQVALWRPEDWESDDEAPRAAALSADGRHIAILRGQRVWILQEKAEVDRQEGDDG